MIALLFYSCLLVYVCYMMIFVVSVTALMGFLRVYNYIDTPLSHVTIIIILTITNHGAFALSLQFVSTILGSNCSFIPPDADNFPCGQYGRLGM